MAKKRPSRKRPTRTSKKRATPAENALNAIPADWPTTDPAPNDPPRTTGRMLATSMDPDKRAVKSVLKELSNATGMSASASNVAFAGSDSGEHELPDDVNYHVLENLGIVVLNNPDFEHAAAHTLTARDHNVFMEEEMWNEEFSFNRSTTPPAVTQLLNTQPIAGEGISTDYLLGMRDLIDLLLQQQTNQAMNVSTGLTVDDNSNYSWGLMQTGVANSSLTGKGINVAILDSGLDITHPDFVNAGATTASFIPGGTDRDANKDLSGHGTHCAGIACGPENPEEGPRFGVAYNANIYSGKVLTKLPNRSSATGKDQWILAGINWAIANQCRVISLSLGPQRSTTTISQAYESAAQRALQQGSLIVAATGNSSNRSAGSVLPVSRPANCPSIVGVAAVDQQLQVANFSNGLTPGNVDLAGPGVNVRSSVPLPEKYASLNGTSMATPHVAGIAALICEETGKTGQDLRNELNARIMSLGSQTGIGQGFARISTAIT